MWDNDMEIIGPSSITIFHTVLMFTGAEWFDTRLYYFSPHLLRKRRASLTLSPGRGRLRTWQRCRLQHFSM